LIQAGADINARDNDGHTPLKRASDYEKPAMAEFLRSQGAKK
jgi:ankyrin repeat protein